MAKPADPDALAVGLIRAVPGDVSDEDQVHATENSVAPCPVMICNAHIAGAAPSARTARDQLRYIIAVTLTDACLIVRRALAQLWAGDRLIAVGLRGATSATGMAWRCRRGYVYG
ncbi:hypothetical protein [Paracoccus sp. Ld10]|uniref:hypothetical protein n=1 Tax=Paracoccus sp. Ld10 TaxID=649158 RepID=UPI00386E5143